MCGLLKPSGMLKCWVLFMVMLVLNSLGDFSSVSASRLVVMIISVLCSCVVDMILLRLCMIFDVLGYCVSMLKILIWGSGLVRFCIIILILSGIVCVCMIFRVCGNMLVLMMKMLLFLIIWCASVIVLVVAVVLLSIDVFVMGSLVRFLIIVWKVSSVLSRFWLIFGW